MQASSGKQPVYFLEVYTVQNYKYSIPREHSPRKINSEDYTPLSYPYNSDLFTFLQCAPSLPYKGDASDVNFTDYRSSTSYFKAQPANLAPNALRTLLQPLVPCMYMYVSVVYISL